MADNVTADPGTGGAVFATDDIGGVHYPITKVTIGALDSQTLLTGGNGATDAGTVRVTISSDTTGVVGVGSVIPGVAATNLGKAIDSAVGGTDTGVAILAKHVEDNVHITTANGDYDILEVDSRGALTSNIEQHHTFDELDATTGWSALNDDTTNIATTTIHAIGTSALTFDKVDGTANTVFAAIQKTVSSTDLGSVSPHDIIQTMSYIPDLTNVDYVFVRIGTNNTNYNEWRIPSASLTAAEFETLAFIIGDISHSGSTGTGWDSSAITWFALGVAFNAETNTLAGIIFDQLSYHTNTHTSASIQSEVTSSVSSSNVNVQKVGNQVVNTQSGNVANGTQRVTIATDDANLSAINTTATTIETNTDFGTVLGGGAEVSALRVTIANDSTGVISIDDGGGSITVDAASLPLPAGAATETTLATVETNTDFGTVIGGGTEATALRVTIASDTTGVLSIDDGGGAITIDAVSLPLPTGAATESTLATIDVDTGNIAAGYAAEGAALGSGVLIQGDDGTDRTNVLVDTDGHLQVDILSGGGGGTQDTEDDAIAAGQTVGINVAMAYLYDGVDWSRAAAGTGVVNAQTQRVTIATDDTVTVDATALDIRALTNTDVVTAELSATDNAVLDSIDTNTTGLNTTVGTDGAAGPAGALSVGGTEAGGNFQEVRVDTDGHLQVDVLSGGGSGPTDTDDDAVAAGQSPALNIAMAYMYDGTDWSRAASGTGVRTLQTQRVTIATDDVVPASQSGTWNITNVSGTVSLPTGAATEATLGAIDTDTGNIAAGYAVEGAALGSGVLIQGDDGVDRTNVLVDTDGHLQVDILSGGGGGTQDTEDDAIAAGQTVGINVAMAYVYDGTDWSRAASGTGVRTAQTQRVTIATDDVVPASQSGTWNITNISGTVSLPTGAATEATLGTIDTDTGNIAAGYAAEGAALGSGVLIQGDDGTDRTNVLVDTDGHLQVDVLTGGGGGTQDTEDDAIAAGQTVGINVAMAYLYDGVDWSRAAAGAGAVNAQTQRVTIATDDTVSVDNAGTFAVQEDGAALTALQKLDNIAHAGSDVALVEHVPISGQFDDVATTAVTENQIAPVRITSTRALHVEQQGTVTVSATALDIRALTNSDVVTAELSATDNTVLDNIDTNTTGLDTTVGTDGAAGPAGALSVGGTEAGGNFQEVRVDTDGHLQVDVLSGGGSGPTDTDDDAVAAGQSPALNIAMAYMYDGTDWSRAASGTGVRTLQTQRVTIATDDTVTVAATDLDIRALVNTDVVTAELSATDNAVLDTIASSVYSEDSPSATTDPGTFTLAVRRDTPVSGVSTDGDYASFNVDSTGHLYAREISSVGHDNAAPDWVNMAGLEARSTIDPTPATQGNAVYGTATLLGKQVNHPYATPGLTWQYASATGGVTDTADDVAKAAAGATVRNYVTGIQVINGHATVSTEVVVKDGSTVIWRGWAEAAGGGVSAKVFLRGTANTAINVANITTGSKTYFNLQGHTATE